MREKSESGRLGSVLGAAALSCVLAVTGCSQHTSKQIPQGETQAELSGALNVGKAEGESTGEGLMEVRSIQEKEGAVAYPLSELETGETGYVPAEVSFISLNPFWSYGEFSRINSGTAVLYRSTSGDRKNRTICVNPGHGTVGGSSVKTLCHPDGTPKVTGGTTGAGAVEAAAVSGGTTFLDGTPESQVTLAMGKSLKNKLLEAGYDVLLIREGEDVQLDNIARTVIANNASDCHISLHWDSTKSDKGVFYMSVPNVESYRNMEPVKSNWQRHNQLGESLIAGLKGAGMKLFSGGSMEMDLTQTSYSTVPSIDIELGDRASDHSQERLDKLAEGLVAGINQYFEKQGEK